MPLAVWLNSHEHVSEGTSCCRLMEEHPADALSWYASGCYYMSTGQVRLSSLVI